MAKSDKTVIIKRKEKYEPGEFAQFSKSAFVTAAKKLSKNGLILWLYLCENKNGYKFTVSQTGIKTELELSEGVSKSITRAGGAFDELVKCGFIKDGVFFADGPESEEEKIEDVKKIEVKAKDFELERKEFNNNWGF